MDGAAGSKRVEAAVGSGSGCTQTSGWSGKSCIEFGKPYESRCAWCKGVAVAGVGARGVGGREYNCGKCGQPKTGSGVGGQYVPHCCITAACTSIDTTAATLEHKATKSLGLGDKPRMKRQPYKCSKCKQPKNDPDGAPHACSAMNGARAGGAAGVKAARTRRRVAVAAAGGGDEVAVGDSLRFFDVRPVNELHNPAPAQTEEEDLWIDMTDDPVTGGAGDVDGRQVKTESSEKQSVRTGWAPAPLPNFAGLSHRTGLGSRAHEIRRCGHCRETGTYRETQVVVCVCVCVHRGDVV